MINCRIVNYDGVYNYSNLIYAHLMLKHLSIPGTFAYLLYTFLVGSQLSSDIFRLLADIVRNKQVDWRNDILPSLRGRLSGVAIYRRESIQ